MATKERLQVVLELLAGSYKREAKAAASATDKLAGSASKAGGATSKMTTAQKGATVSSSKWAQATKGVNKELGAFQQLGIAASVVFVAKKFADAAARLGDLAVQTEAWNRRAETVFGNQIDRAREWANAQNEAFGMGEQALLGMLAATGDLLVPLGFTRDVALDLSQKMLIAANAGNEWSAGAVTVESAAERVRKAMLGEREGLIELGIKISEADLQQRLLATGKSELTGEALKQAKAEETLNLIYEQSTDSLNAATDGTAGLLDARKELEAIKADASEKLANETLPAQIAGYRGLAAFIARAKTVMIQFDGDLSTVEKNAAVFNDRLEQTEILSGEALSGIARFSAGVADAAVQTRRDTDAVAMFAEGLKLTGDEYSALAMMLGDSPELFGLAADQGDDLSSSLIRLAQNQRNVERATADTNAEIGDASELENLGKIAEEAGKATLKAADDFTALEKAHMRAAAAARDQVRAEDEIAQRMREAADPVLAAVRAWQDAAEAQKEFEEAAAPTIEQVLAAADANTDLAVKLDALRDQGAFEQGMDAIASALDVSRERLDELLGGLEEYKNGDWSNTITTNFVQNGYPPTTSGGSLGDSFISGRAQGGPTSAGVTYQVGEGNKPELYMIPGDGGRVFSNAESRALMGAMSGSGGDVTINMTGTGDPNIDSQRVGATLAVVRRMET